MQNFIPAGIKGWTYVRTYSVRTILSEPKFIGYIVYQIILPMVLRCARFALARVPLLRMTDVSLVKVFDLRPFPWNFRWQTPFKADCCRASAGSKPYSWAIWDFSSMVPWFHGSVVHLRLQRCAVSGLLKQVLGYRACFSLRSNPPFCFALM